jgi:hypothetical protein
LFASAITRIQKRNGGFAARYSPYRLHLLVIGRKLYFNGVFIKIFKYILKQFFKLMAIKKAENVESIAPEKAARGAKKEAVVSKTTASAPSSVLLGHVNGTTISKSSKKEVADAEKALAKASDKASAMMNDYYALDKTMAEAKRKQDGIRKQVIEIMQSFIDEESQNVRFGDSLLSKTIAKATAVGSEAMMELVVKILPEEAFVQTRTINWDYVLQRPELLKKTTKIGVTITKKESHRLK